MEVLKDEVKSESTKSDLGDMWYMGIKKTTHKTLKDQMATREGGSE
jgi:hypothetical protein